MLQRRRRYVQTRVDRGRIKVSESVPATLEEARRTAKRPAEDRRETYPDDRKRVAGERRFEGSSRFEERSTAEELLKHVLDGISPLPVPKFIQVSMDAPNVNLKFITLLQEHIKSVTDNEVCSLLNLGTYVIVTIWLAGMLMYQEGNMLRQTHLEAKKACGQVSISLCPPTILPPALYSTLLFSLARLLLSVLSIPPYPSFLSYLMYLLYPNS
uniref:Uncharacterized protein n=1 Tax=Timema bartmani TaxID=61472 RepID=A0A7R9ER72_9NEOP|nr:unnamed protein product [Timema bartmani]